MKVKSETEVAQSCLTLSDPMDCSLPGFSIHGVFQARVLEWGATAFSEIISRRAETKIQDLNLSAVFLLRQLARSKRVVPQVHTFTL